MTDADDNLADSLRTVVIQTLDSWDISMRSPDSPRAEITVTRIEDNTYEATVPTIGRVLLDELLDEQGSLLYSKNGVNVSLKGFQDDQLLLELVRND